MRQQHHRVWSRGHPGDHRTQPLGIVGVLGPVDRSHEVRRRSVYALGKPDHPALHHVADGAGHLGLDIADMPGPASQPLPGQLLHCPDRGCKEQVSSVIGDDAVDLLWHPAVERPETGLHVCHRHVHLHCGQGACNGAVGVPEHHHPVGPVLLEHRVKRRQDVPRLDPVAARADTQHDVRRRQPQVLEEHVRHQPVVMLTSVQHEVFVRTPRGLPAEWGDLEELRTRADDAHDLHRCPGLAGRSTAEASPITSREGKVCNRSVGAQVSGASSAYKLRTPSSCRCQEYSLARSARWSTKGGSPAPAARRGPGRSHRLSGTLHPGRCAARSRT